MSALHRNPSRTGEDVTETANAAAAPAGANGPSVTPTRASAAWTSVGAAVLLGVLLVVFLLQNMDRARVNFLFLHARLPIAVALLIATLVGAGVTLLIGAIRIRQLRHRISSH